MPKITIWVKDVDYAIWKQVFSPAWLHKQLEIAKKEHLNV
jgi:hypothetical protein